MSASLDDFYPYVMPDVPGCPEMTIDVALRSALIEFCEKTLLVQRDHDPITVIANTADYDLEPPTGQLVTKIMRAWYNNVMLDPVAPDNVLYAEIYNTLYTGANPIKSDPRNFIQKDERSITVYPMPKATATNALTLRVAYKPTRNATSFEDVLFEDYAEVIANGAKYRLMGMSGKPWTNGPGAATALALFNNGLNVARQRASRGSSRADVRIKLTGV